MAFAQQKLPFYLSNKLTDKSIKANEISKKSGLELKEL
jgi:hypothetical protein